MSAPPGQTLPPKEAAVFKTIVKFYEQKQYKKGIKAAEAVLKKFPDHGETLAMKGLTLNCMDRKQEAYEYVRNGLKKNMLSHVCWHVYGLLYRSDRDYKEAIKCYKQALKRDKDNNQILRDLSLLQIQMRESAGFAETRRQLLTLNAKNRNYWIGFAVATHYAGDLPKALLIIESYESTLEKVENPDYEHSEMLLYKAQILEEIANKADDAEREPLLQKCLTHLESSERLVLDKIALREKRGELLLRLGRKVEAEAAYRELLSINSENYGYHQGLLKSRGYDDSVITSGSEQTKLLELYKEMQQSLPKSLAMKRMPLDFLTDDSFRAAFHEYVKAPLRKGVPSLFNDLKPLYRDLAKVEIMEDVMVRNRKSLQENQCLAPVREGEPNTNEAENPVTLLWVLVYLANHFDRRERHAEALAAIDQAMAYTPTVIDLHLTRARILKHAGSLQQAADECETARKMDLADRFLNTMSTRYLLRADRVTEADSVVSLFTKDGDNPNNLHDMQCMWYEIEYGRSCVRSGEYGKALKKLTAVDKHFSDIVEDQFDFHTYCLRKMTLRAYLALLRFEDTVYKHKFFVRAACSVVSCYISLHDKPALAKRKTEDEEMEGLSEAERKKLKAKQAKLERKKALDAARAEEEAKAKEKKGGKDDKKKHKPVKEDDDPDGAKLAQVEKPLEEAVKLLERLQEHAADRMETHTLSIEVYRRRGKLLKVLQSIKRASSLSAAAGAAGRDPELHLSIVRFLKDLAEKRAGLSPVVAKVLELELAASKEWGIGDLSSAPAAYNDSWAAELEGKAAAAGGGGGKVPLLAALACARAAAELDPGQLGRAAAMVVKAGAGGGARLRDCEAVLQWMDAAGVEPAPRAAFLADAAARFPLSDALRRLAGK